MQRARTLAGKHALVTGGGTGIGAAIALALAECGAAVTICGRRLAELHSSAKRHDNIHAEAADVTDADSLRRLYTDAQGERGSFGIVVANAGAAESAPTEKVTRALWDHTIAVNLTGAFLSVQPALAAMRARKWGRIVFIASTAGLKGYAYVAPYVAAKHGVVGLARALAAETAVDGITVNAVCPGFTETPMLERAVDRIVATTKRSESETRSTLAADNPQARFIKPEEVAAAVVWLCADESAAITGQAISVSGGETW
ncbi:MAG: SDR family oxidoreductase [Rhizobiales bacterium]|nr:SDR family oxidoreductase [Hyphomicrobiales bacterium]